MKLKNKHIVKSKRGSSRRRSIATLRSSKKLREYKVFCIHLHHIGLIIAVAAIGLIGFFSTNNPSVGNAAVAQRFPGDPNPLISGKAYFGTSGANVASHEASAGKSVAVYRKFNQWDTASSAATFINSQYTANRLVWISFKTPKWSEVANGQHDATLDSMLRTLDGTGKPVWVTFWHEPENDENTATGGTAAEYIAMQRRIRQRMNVVGTHNIAFAPIYQSWKIVTMGPAQHDAWFDAGIWDFIGFDIYQEDPAKTILDSQWTSTMSWVLPKGLPYAVGEWGVRSTAPASEIYNFWNWPFANKKDMVAMSYYDSNLNSNGSWALANNTLPAFIDVLKNDSRIVRIQELGSLTPPVVPDTTTPNTAITTPTASSTVSGTVTVAGTASDNIGVKSVELLVDGSVKASDTTSPYSFSYDTTLLADGTHVLMLRATDTSNNTATSASVSVTVKNAATPIAPTPEQPVGGGTSTSAPASTTAPQTTTITANSGSGQPLQVSGTVLSIAPTDPNSSVSSINVDGKTVVGTNIDTKSLTNGEHTITVEENGTKKEIKILVKNPWNVALMNNIRENAPAYAAAGTTILGLSWFVRKKLWYFTAGLLRKTHIHI